MRTLIAVILCGGVGMLCGQTLPPYLIDTFPAANAFSVPVNVNIVLHARVALQMPPFASAGYYTLKASNGTPVSFASTLSCNCFGTVLVPTTQLLPNTLYTFTVNPGSGIGDPYTFSFTTGPAPDNVKPHIIGVSPRSGSSGLGLTGPFTFQFDKQITRMADQSRGITIAATPPYIQVYPPTATLGADGTTVIISVGFSQGSPSGYTITVDPAQFVDAYGNAGEGAPVTANYTTFVTTDSSGPHLQASLPADGDTGVVTNVMPRLIFQKAVNTGTVSKGIELKTADGAQSVPFNLSSNIGYSSSISAYTIVPSKLLAPNQTYAIVVNSNLTDSNGFPVQQPQTIHFTTGSGPDIILPAVLGQSPPSVQSIPSNVAITIRTNKPIASIVPARLTTGGLGSGSYGEGSVTVSATLSPDGTLLTLTPQAPLPPNSYRVYTSEIVDTSGAPFFSSTSGYSIQFNVTGGQDDTSPAMLAINPPPGSDSIPTTNSIQLLFNKTCANCLFPGAITISNSAGTIPATITADYDTGNARFTLTAGTLKPSTTYTVLISGITDLAGHSMPDYSSSFTTAAANPNWTPLNLLDSTIANGATGIDASPTFVFHYDAALNPVSAMASATLWDPSNFAYAVIAKATGSTLTITPVSSLAANTAFRLTVTAYSVLGSFNQTQINFTTAPGSDTTRPQVMDISPSSGATLPTGNVTFVVTFSEPINPSTLTANSLSVYRAGSGSNLQFVRSEDNRSVSFPFAAASDPFSVIASADIRDLAGNSLVPFEANYQVAPNTTSIRSPVHEVRPPAGAANVAANTTITWFLDPPVDLEAIQKDLVVLANNYLVPGSFDLSGGGRILRFTPAAPFPASAKVSLYEFNNLLGVNAYNSFLFTIADAPAPGLRYIRSTAGSSFALDAVLEVEFNQDPPLGQHLVTLNFSSGYSATGPVPFIESIPRPHVLRLTTTTPRKAGYYTLGLSGQVTATGTPGSLSFTLTDIPVGGSPTVKSAGPVDGATDVSLNASARILLGAAINPLSVTAQSASISVGGQSMALLRNFPSNNQELILTPVQALPPNSNVTIFLTGLEDMVGHRIPDTSLAFTTGTDVDYFAPTVLTTSLPYVGGSTVEIGPNEPIEVVFSKPIDPGVTISIGYGSGWLNNAATLTLSRDLRVLTIAPVNHWMEGEQYNFNVGFFSDLSGNPGSTTGTFETDFQVAFKASVIPPQVIAVSPPQGSTAMPLNAHIVAAFDKPVSASSWKVKLADTDGNIVDLRQSYSPDVTRLVFAPVLALRPNTAYTFTIAGAADMSGNLMSNDVTTTFVTSETPDYTAPIGNLLAVSPLPTNLPIRIRFNKAICPATVTPQSIQLSYLNTAQVYIVQPVDLTITGDNLLVTVTPRQPLIPGQTYRLYLPALTDFAGNSASFNSLPFGTFDFVAGGNEDTTPPEVRIIPLDGTTGFPTRSRGLTGALQLTASFSEPADLLASPPVIQVSSNGNPVSGWVSTTTTTIAFTPFSPLAYDTTYRIEVSGVSDYAGNTAAPVSSTFKTIQTASAEQASFKVASTQPSDGSVGIPNDAKISVTFSKALGVPQMGAFLISSSSKLPFYGKWSSVDAYTMQFTPSSPWPSAATITVSVFRNSYFGLLTDASGMTLDRDFSFRFTTGLSPDTSAPELVSITPASGTSLTPGSNTFTLTFSEPVIVGSQAIQAFNGSDPTSVNTYYGASAGVVTATVYSVAANTTFTLTGAGITDGANNAVTPFSYQYPTLAASVTARPSVSSISPSYNAVAPSSTPIKIQFNKRMDPTSLLASVHVTQDGLEVTGQWQMLDSNQSAQFTAGAPYNAGSRIDVFVLTTATDANGTPLSPRYQSYFMVAGTAGQAAAIQQMSVALVGFGEAVDPAGALDLAFDRDLDPSTIGENIWLRAGLRRVPGSAELRGTRAIRFQPSEPLLIGEQYVLTSGPDIRSVEGLSNKPREFRFHAEPGGPQVTVQSVEYVNEPGPLAVRIRFSGAVNPISAGGLEVLAADGSNLPVSISYSTDGREWLLHLPKPQPVRVVLDRVEDGRGRRLPRLSREPVIAR
jgi:large repetitive protein